MNGYAPRFRSRYQSISLLSLELSQSSARNFLVTFCSLEFLSNRFLVKRISPSGWYRYYRSLNCKSFLRCIDILMATDSEKRLLKELLDGFETVKLCEIARSVYRGGGISVHSREGNSRALRNYCFSMRTI